MRAVILASLICCPVAAATDAPVGGWPSPLPITVGQPAAPPVADGVPVHVVEVNDAPSSGGQQHRFALNFALGQPSVARVGLKVLDRENNSVWLEAYGGSAIFDVMYGFGARLQHTAWNLGNGDSFMVSPGLGVQILPDWYASSTYYGRGPRGRWYTSEYGSYNSLYFLAGDVDFSWLHDFSPRFGFELGLKLGLAGRLGGTVGHDYPSGAMWGKSLYPIVAFYTGVRF